jgi:hypothetical protein
MCEAEGCYRCFRFWLYGLMVTLTGHERDHEDRCYWWKVDA